MYHTSMLGALVELALRDLIAEEDTCLARWLWALIIGVFCRQGAYHLTSAIGVILGAMNVLFSMWLAVQVKRIREETQALAKLEAEADKKVVAT